MPPPVLLSPEEAQRQGHALVANLLAQEPAGNNTNVGVLKIKGPDSKTREVWVRFDVVSTGTSWINVYQTTAAPPATLVITHTANRPNDYALHDPSRPALQHLAGNQAMVPFAGSDFWLADLGLEFLHWSHQKVTRTQMRKGQSCDVLESINPDPAPNAYSRVVAWMDRDTGGIVFADAYDSRGKLLKQFEPKGFQKVQGRWELEEMEIRNLQAGTRTRIEFKLGADEDPTPSPGKR